MKFTVNRKQFLSALKTSAQAVGAKNLLPIMECLKLDSTSNSDTLTIIGGNEEMFITSSCQMVELSEINFSLCVNAKDLVDAVSSIDDETVIISTDESTGIIEVKYKRGMLSYPFFSGDEYSLMPVSDSDSSVSIPEDVLSHLINKAVKFVSSDPLRPTTMGVNFSIGEEGETSVVCVGTDSSKLCKVSVSGIDTSKCKERKSFILPNKACQVVAKSLPSNPSDKMVDISFSEKNIKFDIGHVEGLGGISIFTRCIEGKFPNYNAVIPKNNPIKIEFPKSDFISAIGRVSKSLSKIDRIIEMDLLLSGIMPEAKLSANNPLAKISGNESLECTIMDESKRENMAIRLNKDHIEVAVSNASTPNIAMSFSSPVMPILIEGRYGDDGVTILVMPFA